MFLSSKTIGIVTWDYADGKGGLGRALKEIVDAIEESGTKVIVATPSSGFLSITKKVGGHLLFSFLLPFTLQKWVDRNHVDVLIIPVGPGGVFLFRKPKNCQLIGICYHTYSQQSALVPGQAWKKMFIPLERRTLSFCMQNFVYSADTKNHFKNSILLPQIIDLQKWKPSSGITKKKGQCICVARLEKRKGVVELLEAWKAVVEKNLNATLIIVGDGILRQSVDATIKNLESVTRVPHVSEIELIKLIQESEIMICPSYLEGFGLAATEAMAAGTLVLGFDTEGLRSLITDNQTGILVSPNSKDLADAILLHLEHDHALMEKSAQKFVLQKFDHDEAKKALLKALEASVK